MTRVRVIVAVIGVLVTLLAACSTGDVGSTDTSRTGAPSPFASCPAAAPSGPPAPSGAAGGRALPSVALPCFTGGRSVDLARLGRRMVINFWASTCSPCRKEMPQFQQFAASVNGRLLVIGVDTADGRDAAAAAGVDFGATYPMVFDPQSKLLSAWGRQVLPVTLFVDQFGIVRGEDMTGALTVAGLNEKAGRYLGITP
jgi:thiol-disulfide isomerase/thioredoxin